MSLRSQLHDHNHDPKVDDTLTETATNRCYGTFFRFCSGVKVCFPSQTTFLTRSYRRLKDGGTAEPGVYDRITKHKTAHLIHYGHRPLPSTSVLRWPQPPDHHVQSVGTAPRFVRAYGVGAVQTRPGMRWAWSTESGAPIGRPRNRVSSKRVICYHGGETLAQTRGRKEHAAERREQGRIVIRGIGSSRVVCTWY